MMKAKINRFCLFLLCLSMFLAPLGVISYQNVGTQNAAYAQSITDLEGTNTDNVIVRDGRSGSLATSSYIVGDNIAYDTSRGSEGFAFAKENGEQAPFASFFIKTYGEGGEVLQSKEQLSGYDSYGYIAGSGEVVYARNSAGEIMKDEKGENVIAGYKTVGVELQYNYALNADKSLRGANSNYWQLSDDSWEKSINGISSVGKVGYGAVIVQKFVPTEEKSLPTSNSDWKREYKNNTYDGLHTVNFFEEFSPNDKTQPFTVYTPSGEDLQSGVYVKITVAYEIRHCEGWKFFQGYQYTYRNIVEETVFYLCNSSGEVVFNNLYFEASSGEESAPAQSQSSEAERKGGPISNNQGAIDGFRLDTYGENYEITYTENGSSNVKTAYDGDVFFNPGRYDFVIETKIGMVRNKTVYIHENGKDRNKQIYFGDSLFSSDSVKIFDPNAIYPVYLKGQTKIQTADDQSLIKHAPLVGRLYQIDDWENYQQTINFENLPKEPPVAVKNADDTNWNYSDFEEGKYIAIFANNKDYFQGTATGDTYVFVWRFEIAENGQAPSVNNSILQTTVSARDYASLHYVAKIATAGSGNLLVVYPDEASAYAFACKYLASTVKKNGNEFVFDGKTYQSERKMVVALNEKAKTLVEKRYFDANDPSSFLTLKDPIPLPSDPSEDDTQEDVQYRENFVNITKRIFDKDVLIFAESDLSMDMTVGEVYLNDQQLAFLEEEDGVYKKVTLQTRNQYFVKVAEYETSGQTVTVVDETNYVEYQIPFGVSIQEFLQTKAAKSGRYKIIEKNIHGTTEYHVIYIRPGDISTSLQLTTVYNGNSGTRVYSKLDGGKTIRANSIIFEDAFNDLDPYGIIKIKKASGEVIVCQLDEVSTLPMLCEVGLHEIVMQDRLGNSSSIFVRIDSASKICNFTLKDGETILLDEKTYAGKKYVLPTLTSEEEKLKFLGWKDERGNLFNGEYVFDKEQDLILTAEWRYESVEISVFDGAEIAHHTKNVGDLQTLPNISKEGYVLYGYRFKQADGTYRFYRGQIASVPNVGEMRLDAVWKLEENVSAQEGEDDVVKVTLVDGQIIDVLSMEKGEIIDFPKLENKDGLVFEGWLFESTKLSGKIFIDQFDCLEVLQGEENFVKLSALWLSEAESASASGMIGQSGFSAKTVSSLFLNSFLMILLAGALFAFLKRFMKHNVYSYSKPVPVETEKEEAFEDIKNYVRYEYSKSQQKIKLPRTEIRQKKGFYDRFVVPCVVAILCLAMVTLSQGMLMFGSKSLADENAFKHSISQMIDENKTKERQDGEFLRTHAAELDLDEEEYVDENGFTSKENFLIDNVKVDLMEMGYEDVFDATAKLEDRVIKGIGYTNYINAYEVDSDMMFAAGFVAYTGEYILQEEDLERDILVERAEDQDEFEFNKFVLKLDEKWGVNHYVAYEEYVTYYVAQHAMFCTRAPDTLSYVDAYGPVFNYDLGQVCHYTNYDQEMQFDAQGIYSATDAESVVELLKGMLANQEQNGMEIFVQRADFISIEALNSFKSHGQDEKFLNVDADTLLWYEANISSTQYYVVTEDGQVEVLDLPSSKASLWERIWIAVAAIAVAIAGVVLCTIAPGLGDIAGGFLISGAIDVFMQVTVAGTKVDNINWKSVELSALTGAVTGAFGAIFNAPIRAAQAAQMAVKLSTKIGVSLATAFCGATSTYLINLGASQGEKSFSIEEYMKAVGLGMLTSMIMLGGGEIFGKGIEKIASNHAWMSTVGTILAGSVTSLAAYLAGCALSGTDVTLEGVLMSFGMGAAMAGIGMIGNKIVKNVRTGRELKSAFKAYSKKEYKEFKSYTEFKKEYGKAGTGREWHHIVEQNQIKKGNATPEQIYNTKNTISLDYRSHRQISAIYSSKADWSDGKVVRQWMSEQPYDVQYKKGIELLRDIGVKI